MARWHIRAPPGRGIPDQEAIPVTASSTPLAVIAGLSAEAAADLLAALDETAFSEFVRSAISPAPDTEVWAALTGPKAVRRTLLVLTALNLDVEGQLASRKAGMDDFQAQCWASGASGRSAWFEGKREYDEWRRRALGWRRMVQRQMMFAKRHAAAAAPARVPNPQKAESRKHNHDVLLDLARAVVRHQQRVQNGEDAGPEDDEALWSKLTSLTVMSRAGDMPLGEWVGFVDAASDGF